jgi:hypothetical protein
MDFRWRIKDMMQKYKNHPISLTKEELRGLKCLKENIDIMLLKSEKGNCTVVLDKSD